MLKSLFTSMLLLLSISVAMAADLDKLLDQYLDVAAENPTQGSAMLLELEQQLNTETPPLVKARLWLYLASEYATKKAPDKVQHYFALTAELAKTSQHPDIRADLLANQLHNYLIEGQKEQVRAIVPELAQAINYATSERVRYYAAYVLGLGYQDSNRLEEALQAFYQSYHAIANSTHPRTKGRQLFLNQLLAGLNTSLAHYDKALQILNDSIEMAKADSKYHGLLPDYYMSKGVLFMEQKLWPAAEQAYQSGLQWAEKSKNVPSTAVLLNNLGDLRMKQQRLAEASDYFRQAARKAIEVDDKALQITAAFNLGYIDVMQEDFAKGIVEMEKAVATARAVSSPDTEMLSYLWELADAYQRAGNYQQEAKMLREHYEVTQRIFQKDRDEQINALQESFAAEQKAKQIEQLQYENQLNTAEIEQKRLQQRITLLFVIVVVMATALLFMLYRKVRNTNLQLKKANDQLAYNSMHDPLTGLLNRRSLHEYMQKRAAQGERRQANSAVTDAFILLDIDHFKHINDHYSHAAGDAVLVEVGRRLRELTRQGDMVLRWGGEEFLIVLRGINQSGLTNFTNRVLQVIGQKPMHYQDQFIQVYASAGFLLFPFAGVHELQLNWERALHLADMALYMSKVHGRNRAYGLVDLHRPYDDMKQQLETDLSLAIEKGELEITLVLGPSPTHHGQSAANVSE